MIGEVGWDITLEGVVAQVAETDPKKDLSVNIHSVGGSVYDGLAIYNYFKDLDRTVHTKSVGMVASIASIIFLAGKKETRTLNSTDSFLIHLPSGMGFGNAEDLEKTARELREIEGKLADIYAAETDMSREEAIEWMEKDEMLPTDLLEEKGFVAEVKQFKAIAKFNQTVKMSTETEKPTEAENFYSKVKALFTAQKTEEEVKNVTRKTADDRTLDFHELEEGEPALTNKATIDGKDADGEYVMPDGETWNFTNGVFESIKEAAPAEQESDETVALKEEIADLTAKLTEKEGEITAMKATVDKHDSIISGLEGLVSGKVVDDKTAQKQKETKPEGCTFEAAYSKS